MSKKLRQNEPIYVAPEIKGSLDDNHFAHVRDERNGQDLDPYNIEHKIEIYKRQVHGWFLEPAENLVNEPNNGFIVLMICMSYYEGIESYRTGQLTHNASKNAFVKTLERMYLKRYSLKNLKVLYSEARCGLFHNGMTEGKIVISLDYTNPIEFVNIEFVNNGIIKINQKLLLEDIKKDFDEYIRLLSTDITLRDNFSKMFTILF